MSDSSPAAPKPWYFSKTIWINGLLACLAWLATHLLADAQTGQLPPSVMQWSAGIILICNFVLRAVTKDPIDLSSLTSLLSGSTKALLVLGFLWSGVSTLAAPPRAIITGPSTAIYGDRVLLDFSGSIGEQFRCEVSRRDDIQPAFTAGADNRSLEIHFMPGIYDVSLIVANGEGIDVATKTVTVSGTFPPGPEPVIPPSPPNPPPGPAPQPGPQPTPAPTPSPTPTPAPDTLPDGQFGVSQPLLQKLRSLSLPSARNDAKALARAIQSIEADMQSGKITSMIYVAAAFGKATKTALSAHLADWQPLVTWLQSKIEEAWQNNQLDQISDCLKLVQEILLALQTFANS